MKKAFFVFFILVLLSAAWAVSGQKAPAVSAPTSLRPDPDFGRLPLSFVPNRGQAAGEVLYYARTSLYTLWATEEGLVFDSGREENQDLSWLVFSGAEPNIRVHAEQPANERVSYFRGDDPAGWKTDLPTFGAVVYEGVYRAIDLKVYGCEREVEYDWIVKPGGDPGDIRLSLEGTASARLNGEGDLLIRGSFGEIRHRKPVAYQRIAGVKRSVPAAFESFGSGIYGIRVGRYDPAADLVIDPLVLVYSSYLGGLADDYVVGLAVDGRGAVYATGWTYSRNFPGKNAFQPKIGGSYDAFLTKLAPDGRSLVYSTYLGGANSDSGVAVAVDDEGAAYVTGYAESLNFPVKKALRGTNQGDRDGFIAKVSPDGRSLAFSTYWGGSQSDYAGKVRLDSSGAIYFHGVTSSDDFPVQAPFQSRFGGGSQDIFLTKITAACDRVVFSTYLGGTKDDNTFSMAVSPEGEAVIGGTTSSRNYPLKNPLRGALAGSKDAVITRFNADGRTLVFSTYLGGSGSDFLNGIDLDAEGAATVCGQTASLNFPVKNAYQSVYGKGYSDGFLARLSATGSGLIFSSFLGGTSSDVAKSVVLGKDGTICLVGVTTSRDFPLKGAFQKTNAGGEDVFIAKLKYATR